MNTGAWSTDFRDSLVIHFPYVISEGTGCIDDTLGHDIELFPTDFVLYFSPNESDYAFFILELTNHLFTHAQELKIEGI